MTTDGEEDFRWENHKGDLQHYWVESLVDSWTYMHGTDPKAERMYFNTTFTQLEITKSEISNLFPWRIFGDTEPGDGLCIKKEKSIKWEKKEN